MKAWTRILAYGACTVLLSACAENANEPEREIVLTDPAEVETLIAGSFRTWWASDQSYDASRALSAMADELTTSWCGVSHLSTEPREAIDNDPSDAYADVVAGPWFESYEAINATRGGLIAIAGPDGEMFTADDMEIGEDGEDTPRAVAFARFVMGLSYGTLGSLYDRAFVIDETTDVSAMEFADVRPYDEVTEAALRYLQQAIDIASQHTFTIPTDWVGNASIDDQRLVRLAHSYSARFLAYAARNPGERAAVEWNTVLGHIDQGITGDFYLLADDQDWWSMLKYYAEAPDWARTDLHMLGPAGSTAESNLQWGDWETAPPEQRLPFDIDTDDARLPMYPPTQVEVGAEMSCAGQPRSGSCGLYFEYRDPNQPFRPERGTYRFSGYADYRYHDYVTSYLGPLVHINLAEMDLIKAEALIRLGREAEAVPLINTRREANGGLPPVTMSGAPEVAGRCTPRALDGTCGDLFEALKYEKRLEVYLTGMGVAYYDDRGWGDLVTGTAIHFPIPGEELEIHSQQIYTFGGGGPGSAPDIVPWSVAARGPGPGEPCTDGP
ncbi:MAG: hypothetical protein PVJ64_15395 [Gemmatimonadales bacterium]|jgi:hypothetical protein